MATNDPAVATQETVNSGSKLIVAAETKNPSVIWSLSQNVFFDRIATIRYSYLWLLLNRSPPLDTYETDLYVDWFPTYFVVGLDALRESKGSSNDQRLR